MFGTLALFAFALPFLPAMMGVPHRSNPHCGMVGARYGLPECMALSLQVMLVAAIGLFATQWVLPASLRWSTLPKILATGALYLLVPLIAPI